MPVTLKDIADRANVSQMTVSKVLNGLTLPKQPRALARAQRIRELAQRMGYRANAAAQATRSGRFNTLALLLGTRDGRSSLPSYTLRGIQDELNAGQTKLLVSMLPDDRLIRIWGVPAALSQHAADGMIINYTHGIPARLIQLIDAHRFPSVWINCRRPSNAVYPDERSAGQALTRHLLSLGHRRIAFVEFSFDWQPTEEPHFSALDRISGYQDVLRDAGLVPQVIHRLQSSPGEDTRVGALRQALTAPNPPTALILYSTSHLMYAALAAQALGLTIPRDLSLATFSNEPRELLGQDVTCMFIPEQEVGRQSVRLVRHQIETPDAPAPALAIPFELHRGQTSAPPPQTIPTENA